jgi:hypothetical protein
VYPDDFVPAITEGEGHIPYIALLERKNRGKIYFLILMSNSYGFRPESLFTSCHCGGP